MNVAISTTLHAQLLALAVADPAREVCGLLLGSEGQIGAIVEAENVAGDPARTFEIDPRTHISAIKAARHGAARVIGCYHSHPSGTARPSARDAQLAQPESLWLIIADGHITGWHKTAIAFEQIHLTSCED